MSAVDLLAAARARGLMVSVAESCTGGLIAGAITDVAGSSAVFACGFVTYSNTAKIEMLGVRPDTLDRWGAVSEQVAEEMARGALLRARADVALSVTGIAGPGGSEHKPEGRVCFGLAQAGRVQTETVEFGPRGRADVRAASVAHGLGLLVRALT